MKKLSDETRIKIWTVIFFLKPLWYALIIMFTLFISYGLLYLIAIAPDWAVIALGIIFVAFMVIGITVCIIKGLVSLWESAKFDAEEKIKYPEAYKNRDRFYRD